MESLICTCRANAAKIQEEAVKYRSTRVGWSPDIISMIMRKTGSQFPSKVLDRKHVINEQQLAAMLRSHHDRTLVARALEGVGQQYAATIGFCQACIKEIPPLPPPRETEAEQLERYKQDITETLLRHPEIDAAEVSVWKDKPGQGLAVGCDKSKTAFDAELILTDGTKQMLDMVHPSRRTNKELPATIIEYQSSNILWTRIQNRRFIISEYDRDKACFRNEQERRKYEQEVRKKYAEVRNINEACLNVRLFTTQDTVEASLGDFTKICTSRPRYYCEVLTRVPSCDGTPGSVMQVEHVNLRELIDTPNKHSYFYELRDRYISLQERFIQPLRDFEWWRESDGVDRLRRRVGYIVGAGERTTMYSQEMKKPVRQLTDGKRFFGIAASGDRYLSLVEICDQQTGALELKWCLTIDRCRKDPDGRLVPHDLNNLYAVVKRYHTEAGTPEQVRQGRKWHFQVRKVMAYCHGSFETMKSLDTLLKQQTIMYRCDPEGRGSMTEFRSADCAELSLELFQSEATKAGLTCVTPKPIPIAWDLLLGPNRLGLDEWFNQVYQSWTGQ